MGGSTGAGIPQSSLADGPTRKVGAPGLDEIDLDIDGIVKLTAALEQQTCPCLVGKPEPECLEHPYRPWWRRCLLSAEQLEDMDRRSA
jgi:hypothetical protein